MQLRVLHSATRVDFDDLQPKFLSPEMKEAYALWAVGNKPQIGTVDLVSAGVFSVAVVVLSLLCPGITPFKAVDEAETLPKALRMTIRRMLQAKDRIAAGTALQLVNSMHESSASPALSALNELVQVSNFEDATIALEIANNGSGLRANVHFLCSFCGLLIPFTGLYLAYSRCSKHLICTEECWAEAHRKSPTADTTICPLCNEKPVRRVRVLPKARNSKRTCATCQAEFELQPSDPWRLDLMGSNDYIQAQNVCSLRCLGRCAAAQPVQPSLGLRKKQDFGKYKSDIVNFLNSNHRIVQDVYTQLDPQSQREVELDQITIMRKFSRLLNPSQQCHFCHQPIRDLLASRLVLCSQQVEYICSLACLHRGIGLVCLCGGDLAQTSIASALGEGDPQCESCKGDIDERPLCGHSYCWNCLRSAEKCVECEKVHFSLVEFLTAVFPG